MLYYHLDNYYLIDFNLNAMSIFHTVLNNKKHIYSDWLGEEVLSLTDKTFVIPPTYQYEILETTERYIARPDILSYDAYGDTMYADLLCKLNGISNPFELNKGMLLIIPSPDCIMDFMNTPKQDETDSSISGELISAKPVAKQKTAKRKANEAVVGDARFRVDPTNGIVIY